MNETDPPHAPEPVREDWAYTERLDSNGQPYDELEQYRTVFVSPAGAVVEKVWRKERHYHCGHGAEQPMGGRCGEPGCFNTSCHACFTRCSNCQVGLCLYHVRFIEGAAEQKLPVCSHCRGMLQRQRFWRRIWRTLLNPFVSFDETPR